MPPREARRESDCRSQHARRKTVTIPRTGVAGRFGGAPNGQVRNRQVHQLFSRRHRCREARRTNLDVAFNGNGCFQIQLPDGTVGYTRDGAFQVDSNGKLFTNSGFVVQPGITKPNSTSSRR